MGSLNGIVPHINTYKMSLFASVLDNIIFFLIGLGEPELRDPEMCLGNVRKNLKKISFHTDWEEHK